MLKNLKHLNLNFNRCQTYEGGFGATPGNEAHGGYSFCGLASLKLLNKERMCDIDSLTVNNFELLVSIISNKLRTSINLNTTEKF